jgi:hypothetical protein
MTGSSYCLRGVPELGDCAMPENMENLKTIEA